MPSDSPAPTVRLRRTGDRANARAASARPETARSEPARGRASAVPTRKAPTTAQRGGAAQHARVASGRLPNWGDLGGAASAHRSGRIERLLAPVSSRRVVLVLVLVAAAFTAYEAHIYATKDALAAVQAARHENARLHLKLNRLRGEFDAATSPAVVVARARALGLAEGIGYGPTIHVAAPRR